MIKYTKEKIKKLFKQINKIYDDFTPKDKNKPYPKWVMIIQTLTFWCTIISTFLALFKQISWKVVLLFPIYSLLVSACLGLYWAILNIVSLHKKSDKNK